MKIQTGIQNLNEYMKKFIVILCFNLYRIFPNSMGWNYYHDIMGIYISPAKDGPSWPKWHTSWMLKLEFWIRDHLFDYIKRNKDIVKAYHRAIIKKKNENSNGTYYI